MNNTDSDFQVFCKIILVTIGAVFGSIFVLQLTNDTIKYNRYKQEVQEYRKCASLQKDESSVRSFCGEPPSSTIML